MQDACRKFPPITRESVGVYTLCIQPPGIISVSPSRMLTLLHSPVWMQLVSRSADVNIAIYLLSECLEKIHYLALVMLSTVYMLEGSMNWVGRRRSLSVLGVHDTWALLLFYHVCITLHCTHQTDVPPKST
jgi:hypothetical protein